MSGAVCPVRHVQNAVLLRPVCFTRTATYWNTSHPSKLARRLHGRALKLNGSALGGMMPARHDGFEAWGHSSLIHEAVHEQMPHKEEPGAEDRKTDCSIVGRGCRTSPLVYAGLKWVGYLDFGAHLKWGTHLVDRPRTRRGVRGAF